MLGRVELMEYPRVITARAVDECTLLVEFNNHITKTYDITPLLDQEMFAPLKTPAFFKAVEVDQGGYAVVRGNDIDISEYELWRHGREVS
jgi:hypothetical protein